MAANRKRGEKATRRERARQIVADWPPLSAEQTDNLAVLLKPVRVRRGNA